ncbi:unnamed protein product, partial [Clonostachys chloroleuca]
MLTKEALRSPAAHNEESSKAQKGSRETRDVDSGADSDTEESAQSARDCRIQLSEKIKSDEKRKKALGYQEGRCRISGSTEPEVACIMPLSFTNSAIDIDRSTQFKEAFYLFGASAVTASIVSGGVGLEANDKVSNMICLDRNLHSNWDKGYLGTKYLGMADFPGQDTTEITLQVVWMPMVKAAGFSYHDLIDLDDERDEYSGFAYTTQCQADTAPGNKNIL